MSGGPKYSVPAQVASQAEQDDVFWINLSDVDTSYMTIQPKNIVDINLVFKEIKSCNPTIVIFEDLYYFEFVKIAKRLVLYGTPYIIVPRGSMTKHAQKRKFIKKLIGNFFYFNSFINGSLAIEYLAENEKASAPYKWRKRKSIVIPNGISFVPGVQTKISKYTRKKEMTGIFIGRIDLYSKGLDVFLKACGEEKELLNEKKCKIYLYGPINESNRKRLFKIITRYNLDDVVYVNKEIHGIEKDKVMQNADFFILTSRFEGMPMGLLESLSYGLPSIVTFGTNIGDRIDSFKAGLCSLCKVPDIKNNIKRMLTLELNDYLEMRANAYQLSKQYDWHRIAIDTHSSYCELLGLNQSVEGKTNG